MRRSKQSQGRRRQAAQPAGEGGREDVSAARVFTAVFCADFMLQPAGRNTPSREIVMTRLLISIFLSVVALLVADRAALAQSAYSYPWCLEYAIAGPLSCYYRSYEQCYYEAFTRGGRCTPSPYYRGTQDQVREAPHHRRYRRHS
jgi:hypothetical protein